MHDINYLITTALPISVRRAHEKDLLAYYLDRLAARASPTCRRSTRRSGNIAHARLGGSMSAGSRRRS